MLPKVKRWLARDDIDNLSKKEHNLATLSLKLQYYNTYCLYRVARALGAYQPNIFEIYEQVPNMAISGTY